MEFLTTEITDDMSDLEKFVRQEADNYVNSTMFLSSISTHHKHIDSVVEKGKEVTPYVVKLYKENGDYSNQNMYTHFFLIVMHRLYGNPFDRYVGIGKRQQGCWHMAAMLSAAARKVAGICQQSYNSRYWNY